MVWPVFTRLHSEQHIIEMITARLFLPERRTPKKARSVSWTIQKPPIIAAMDTEWIFFLANARLVSYSPHELLYCDAIPTRMKCIVYKHDLWQCDQYWNCKDRASEGLGQSSLSTRDMQSILMNWSCGYMWMMMRKRRRTGRDSVMWQHLLRVEYILQWGASLWLSEFPPLSGHHCILLIISPRRFLNAVYVSWVNGGAVGNRSKDRIDCKSPFGRGRAHCTVKQKRRIGLSVGLCASSSESLFSLLPIASVESCVTKAKLVFLNMLELETLNTHGPFKSSILFTEN